MTRALLPSERTYIAPRRYVPKELEKARIGTMDQSAQALAYLMRRRIQNSRGGDGTATVLVDIDGAVYACLRNGPTLSAVIATHPALLVGVYNMRSDIADVAADIETFRRFS